MYNHFNPNPCGKNVGDCTVRAIVKATGKDWGEIYLRLCIQGYLDGDMPSANACWGRYLRSIGYQRYIAPDTCPDCYTVGQFAEDHLTDGKIPITHRLCRITSCRCASSRCSP